MAGPFQLVVNYYSHLHLHLHLQGNGYKEAYACENPYLILHQYLSRFDLKAFTDFDDITYTYLGSLFQALTTR